MAFPTERLVLTVGQAAQVVAHSRAELPNESCGLLGGLAGQVERVFPLANAERSPVRYTADPQAQLDAMMAIEERGWEMVAIYHSHPKSPAYPSPTDLERVSYPEALALIVSLADPDRPVLRAFCLAAGGVQEVDVAVRGDESGP